MKSKILKLAKRLGKFCAEDILPIISIPEVELQKVLFELKSEGAIKQRSDGTYFYQVETKKENKKLPLFFEFRTKEELDLIIKCFSAEVPVSKTSKICNLSDDIIATFSTYFRKTIYEKQLQELDSYFNKRPQQFRLRKFYDKTAYFYFYNEKLFVTENPMQSKEEQESFKPTEIKKFKILYSRIKRILNQNTRRILLHHHITECLWRDSKDFEVLIHSLYQMLRL